MDVLSFLAILGVLTETSFLVFREIGQKKTKKRGKRRIFVDTSSLIDGRILQVAETGFLSDDFFIPRSVIRELQLLADGKDNEKRNRARAGMNVANALERVVFFNTEIFDDSYLGKMPVDERLLVLAKDNNGAVLTCDYNLVKVAEAEKIETLNINDLAIVLGNKFREGDVFNVKILEKGSNPRQGVGHLPDGTMVVVDGAEKMIGKEVEVRFLRFLQTSSGRMIFSELERRNKSKKSRRH